MAVSSDRNSGVTGSEHNGVMSHWDPTNTSPALRGRPLRYLLVKILADAQHPLTVAELIVLCGDEGVVFDGRASKLISDALRWEQRAGRVKRPQRGVYTIGRVPRSTMRWIKQRTDQTRYWLRWCQDQPQPPRDLTTPYWEWDPESWVPSWPLWHVPD